MIDSKANIAVILAAGGLGERCRTSSGLPKQFLELEGEPVYIWSLKAFCHHARLDKIIVVVAADLVADFKAGVAKFLPESCNRIAFAFGGTTRQASVRAGLEALAAGEKPPAFVLIHDAARPFVRHEEIDAVISGLTKNGGCVLGRPVSDTIKKVHNELIVETIDRQGLWSMQTPQGADFSVLLKAHRDLQSAGVETTDDASVLERANAPVTIVQGSPLNFKITNMEDFYLAQSLAGRLKSKGPARLFPIGN